MTTFIFEKNFVNEIITDFDKVLSFLQPGFFGKGYIAPLVLKSSVGQVSTFIITEEISALIKYYVMFKEQYPTDPTPLQKQQLNAIRLSMNLPPI